MDRRTFLRYGGAAGMVVGLNAFVPGYARMGRGDLRSAAPAVLDGSAGLIELVIEEASLSIAGRMVRATTVNGTLPGPVLRFREGDEAVIRVTNRLRRDTSLHWHGILLPNGMDGVPKVTYPGIRPGETFEYRYPVRQSGTYWYHSHSGFQEQLGQFGAYIIDPAGEESAMYDRDYVVVLSDWTFENLDRVMARLKKRPDYYNYQKRTVLDFFRDASKRGLLRTVGDRLQWGGMRMSPTDISDVTGATYTYLVNGMAPEQNWTGLFRPGERVRLRFINASAASYFDVRIPGLPMTVIQAMGQDVKPVETDEFRIAVAETYDVIAEPKAEAYTVFAEAMDRSGFARGTLATRQGLEAAVPARRKRPTLTMADMGMDMGGMDMKGMDMGHVDKAGMGMGAMGGTGMSAGMARPDSAGMPVTTSRSRERGREAGAMSAMSMKAGVTGSADQPPGALPAPARHGPDHHGPGNASVAKVSKSRLAEAGLGLGEDGWRVLRYTDLRTMESRDGLPGPDREIEIHLTGNMERFIWSMDGKTYSEAEPIRVRLGERVRLTMVNDTMMNHPMHLHGMWMELENGAGVGVPKIHTVNVKPAERLSVLIDADAPGKWAFHCHILYHMEAGMFRVVEVVNHAVAGLASAQEVGR